MFSSIAHALGTAPQGADGAAPSMMQTFMPIILIIGIFYFLLIRPQQKKQKEHQGMLNNLKKGDPVVTSGGLYGRIVEIDNEKAVVDLGEHKVTVMRQALNLLVDKSKATVPLKKEKPGKKKDKDAAPAEPEDSQKDSEE